MAAARFPARSDPANNQFFFPIAIGRMAFSTGLLSIGSTPLPSQIRSLRRVWRRFAEGVGRAVARAAAERVLYPLGESVDAGRMSTGCNDGEALVVKVSREKKVLGNHGL
jgi:hypothetical protein